MDVLVPQLKDYCLMFLWEGDYDIHVYVSQLHSRHSLKKR